MGETVNIIREKENIRLPMQNPFLVLLDPNSIPAQLFVFIFFIFFGLLVYGSPGVTTGILFFLCFEVALILGSLIVSKNSFYEISVDDVVLHMFNSWKLRSIFKNKHNEQIHIQFSFYQPFYLEGTTLGVICAERETGTDKKIKLGVYPKDLFMDLVNNYNKPSV